jgi:hypothetical protein
MGAARNRTNVLELNSRNVAYTYDNIYRLTSEAVTADPGGSTKNGTVSYTRYDNVGNRLAMTSTLNAVPGGTFTYDNNDRLTTDTYDSNGNTTAAAGIADTYDFENHMLTHGAVTMVYDADGNRVSETEGRLDDEVSRGYAKRHGPAACKECKAPILVIRTPESGHKTVHFFVCAVRYLNPKTTLYEQKDILGRRD